MEPDGETITKLNEIGKSPQEHSRAFLQQPDTSNLTTRQILEGQFNGTIPITNIDPDTGYQSEYYANDRSDNITNRAGYRNREQIAFAQLAPDTEIDYSRYGDDMPREFIDRMNSDERFQQVMQRTRREEGGYVNRPNDRGGETNFGISNSTYPNENIRELTRERADALLYRDFWNYNGINTLPDELAEVVFDNAVNQSGAQAIRNLHRALDIEPTGDIVGSETRRRVAQRPLDSILNNFADEVIQTYNTIIENRPNQEENRRGWIMRGRRYRR